MSNPRRTVEEQAIGWIIRLRDPEFSAWEEFTVWLERDPVHTEVYDALALAEEAGRTERQG